MIADKKNKRRGVAPSREEVKARLQQAKRLDELIQRDMEELARLRALAGALPSGETRHGAWGEKMQALEEKIQGEIDRYLDQKADIREKIAAVPRREERLILFYRYIDFLPFEKIAEKINYSVAQVYRLHEKALNRIENVIE